MSDRAEQRRTIAALATRPVSFQVLGEALGLAPDSDALLDLVIEVLALGMVHGRIDGVRGYLDVVSCVAEPEDVDALAAALHAWRRDAHAALNDLDTQLAEHRGYVRSLPPHKAFLEALTPQRLGKRARYSSLSHEDDSSTAALGSTSMPHTRSSTAGSPHASHAQSSPPCS